MGTVTARFPVGPCAPYVFGGAGVQFGDGTQAVGKLGGDLPPPSHLRYGGCAVSAARMTSSGAGR